MKKKKDTELKVHMGDGVMMTLSEVAEKVVKDEDDRIKNGSKHLPSHPAPGATIEIKGARYSLSRERDGAGDSGHMLLPWDWSKNKAVGENGTIQVGYAVKCGSAYARTFGSDWWLTTPITEILEQGETDEGSWVKFKTGNSVYTVRGF